MVTSYMRCNSETSFQLENINYFYTKDKGNTSTILIVNHTILNYIILHVTFTQEGIPSNPRTVLDGSMYGMNRLLNFIFKTS